MPVGDETTLKAAKSFLERQQLQYSETEEQYCTKLSVKASGKTGHCSVFNSGKIVIGGSDGPIKTLFEQFKTAYEAGDGLPGGVLPFEMALLHKLDLGKARWMRFAFSRRRRYRAYRAGSSY